MHQFKTNTLCIITNAHNFHSSMLSVQVLVDNSTRDLDKQEFKALVKSFCFGATGQYDWHADVCEMIADDLYHQINERFPQRWVQIEVAEDGENGAVSTYPAVTNRSNLEGTDFSHYNPDLNGDGVVDANEAAIAKLVGLSQMTNADLLEEIKSLLIAHTSAILEQVRPTE